ncbi:MAG: hypothetical protein AVDCRST_MAG02-852, partial [uncultured Rubrobacteraceae bacterium]
GGRFRGQGRAAGASGEGAGRVR